jgi:hypothetical protein
MTRFCANCGTEVDDTAIFCPTCGQPIDEAAETEMPPAPAWPDPAESPAAMAASAPSTTGARDGGWDARADEDDRPTEYDAPTRVEPRPEPVAPASHPGTAAPQRPTVEDRQPAMNMPVTMPVTLSAWLVGVGSVLAVLGVIIGLFDGFLNPIELILLVALLAIAATVFFSGSLPDIPNLSLISLVIVLIGFGIALDRLSFGGAGIAELLLFLGTAAAAIGVILLELGHDQPLGGAGA